MQNIHILILDDDAEIRAEIREFLEEYEFTVHEAELPSVAFDTIQKFPIDIAIVDIRLPEINGLDFLKEIRKINPAIEVIMITGHGDIDSAITALRLGAVDFFKKPFRQQEMLKSIEKTKKYINTVRLFRSKLEEAFLQHKDISSNGISLTGTSPAILNVKKLIGKVANVDRTSVLITGESGTGKEIVAKTIHTLSRRNDHPFVTVNCSSVPDELFESEFFGHTKGAFTGAHQEKAGWFEAANHGTLFLDEIGDLKPTLQSKLLRVMENQEIVRLGSTKQVKVDVRLVTATNHDIEKMVAENRFRSDLYQRLHAFTIHIPPLRERQEDIPLLICHFLSYYAGQLGKSICNLDDTLMEVLMKYDYPGNVRELKHMVERAVILCDGNELTLDHFDHIKNKLLHSNDHKNGNATNLSLDILEKDSIVRALRESGFIKSRAARMLNISRQALDRKMVKYCVLQPKGDK
jgi:DNA-binding NtrC family response regulator